MELARIYYGTLQLTILRMNIICGDIYHGLMVKNKGKTETFEYFGPVRHGVPHGEWYIYNIYLRQRRT